MKPGPVSKQMGIENEDSGLDLGFPNLFNNK